MRTAVLLLLDEQPMHGYQLMQTIAERSGGRWSPSPGAVYPTISQLEDEGLVSLTEEGGRRLATLTDAGRQAVADGRGSWADPFAGMTGGRPGSDLRSLIQQVHGAVREVARSGSDANLNAAARILADARRALYMLLADGAPEAEGDTGTDPRD
ncbi:MAG TPA: PadR family transcriptional regulator [Acidimicrobiales bacterium]|nr:PadR family transcriptional regulator [Acidimicrobiales bacterium]